MNHRLNVQYLSFKSLNTVKILYPEMSIKEGVAQERL